MKEDASRTAAGDIAIVMGHAEEIIASKYNPRVFCSRQQAEEERETANASPPPHRRRFGVVTDAKNPRGRQTKESLIIR